VLALQNEIVSAIASELRTTLSAEQKARQSATPRVDPVAYDAYLKARSLYASFSSSANPQTLVATITEYKRAIELDPSYAPSYAGLSMAYQAGSQGSWYAPREAFPNARAAALKAVELDDQLAAAHAALSGALLWYDWNWEGAEREAARALQLNPDSVDALVASESYLTLVAGRTDEAARTSQRILDVDPLNPFSRVQPVWVALFSGRFDDAAGKANALIELWPNNLMGPWFVSSAEGARGRRTETLAACRRVLEMLSGAFVMQPLAECAGNLGLVGETAEARRLIQRLEHPPAGIWIDPAPMGDAYAGVGDADRAIQSYQRGLEERSPNMIYLKTNWFPNAFRDDPRFQQLLAQMNFPR
jgi:tetratricopeptide (TPR) repeat protein